MSPCLGFAPFLNIWLEQRVRRICLFLVLGFALLASSCGQPAELKVNDAVVKLSPVDNNPSALYFTVYGGEQGVELLRVSSPSIIRAEMHDTMSDPKSGMLTMGKLDRVAVPAKGKLEFKRGGKHVMLWGVNKIARRLEKIEVEFLFSNDERILVTAPIEKIAAAADEHTNH